MFCTNCGNPIQGSPATCPHCGYPVEPEEPEYTGSNVDASPYAGTQVMPAQAPVTQPMPQQAPPYHQQQPYGQPPVQNPYPPQQPYGQPQKKSSFGLVVGIIIAILVVGILAAVFIIKPFGGGNENTNANTNATNTVVENQNTQPSSNTENANATSANTNTESKPVEPQPTNTEPATPAIPSAASMSATSDATLGDFTWVSMDAAAGNIPAGATQLTELSDVCGTWKAYMYGNNMDRLFNVDIAEMGSAAQLVCKWSYVHDTSIDEGHVDNTPPSNFGGAFANGSIEATGPGKITIKAFWLLGDREYAAGEFMWPSGEVETIVLARP